MNAFKMFIMLQLPDGELLLTRTGGVFGSSWYWRILSSLVSCNNEHRFSFPGHKVRTWSYPGNMTSNNFITLNKAGTSPQAEWDGRIDSI